MTANALTDLPERMQAKITVEGDCWVWIGARNNKGYGSVSDGRRGKSTLAHRKSYTLTKGEIPEGLQIDHLCENTSCVNPAHLEAVTAEEHRRRITHKDLKPLYYADLYPTPEPTPESIALAQASEDAWAAFFNQIAESQRRYAAMSPEGQAEYDARRHRLHVATGTRCQCERQAVSA